MKFWPENSGRLRLALTLALAASVSCIEVQAPIHILTELSKLQVRDSVGATDSLRVTFEFAEYPCDRGVSAQVSQLHGEISFRMWRHADHWEGCEDDPKLVLQYRYTIPVSQRTDPFVVRFKQPDGVDSVRTVIWR